LGTFRNVFVDVINNFNLIIFFRAYVHYQPSYYHFHVHYTNLAFTPPGIYQYQHLEQVSYTSHPLPLTLFSIFINRREFGFELLLQNKLGGVIIVKKLKILHFWWFFAPFTPFLPDKHTLWQGQLPFFLTHTILQLEPLNSGIETTFRLDLWL